MPVSSPQFIHVARFPSKRKRATVLSVNVQAHIGTQKSTAQRRILGEMSRVWGDIRGGILRVKKCKEVEICAGFLLI